VGRILYASSDIPVPESIWDVIKPVTYEPQEGWINLMEYDPTAIEPDDDQEPQDLPDKPPIEDMPDEDDEPPSDQEENEDAAEIEFLEEEEAEDNDTVDNREQAEQPNEDVERTKD
jgi:hypothetical protein